MLVNIDIVSDFVCPWCFIGKARLDTAVRLVQEKHPKTRFQFNWLPYFLNPDTPAAGEPYRAFLEAKFGGAKAVDAMHDGVRTDYNQELKAQGIGNLCCGIDRKSVV